MKSDIFLKNITVNKNDVGKRLDLFVAQELCSISRRKIQQMIQKGIITVAGSIKKPSYTLKENDSIVIARDDQAKERLTIQSYPLDILHEDEDIIVINKPQGLITHPAHRQESASVVSALLSMEKKLADLLPLRPGVVHRLDKETSGVMVLAKNGRAAQNIINQFKQRLITKEYRAVVWGIIKQDNLSVNVPLKRDSRNRLKMKVSLNQSKNALTELTVLKRYADSTYVALFPHTGRMHQLRVHLKFIGFPILGDKKYGKKDRYDELFLHAYTITFTHPAKNAAVTFQAPLPERFLHYLEEQKNV
jgi:23S rRNA pseudouridine1911/1915/1917 synthase